MPYMNYLFVDLNLEKSQKNENKSAWRAALVEMTLNTTLS